MIIVLHDYAGVIPNTELLHKTARINGITLGNRIHQRDPLAAVEANDLRPVIDSSYPLA